jgi:hypothetical protein
MAPHWIDAKSRYAEISAVDPYIDLAFGTGEASFFSSERQRAWISVLLQLQGISPGDFAAGRFHPDPGWREWWRARVHVPALYRQSAAGLEDQKYCTAYVRHAEFFDALEKVTRLQAVVARVTLGQSFNDYAPPVAAGAPKAEEREPAEAPVGDPEPGTVVIGIIDDGLAFAHERFRLSPYETRVEHLWLQDGDYDPKGSPVPYGRELRKKEIDDLLRHYQPTGFVDEDGLYRRVGAIDFRRRRHQSVARRAAHGTHVMDLACGYDFRQEAVPNRPIICVQLPAATTEDTSGATLDDHGLDAIRYILDRADAIARRRGCGRLPVVINLSYGNVAGPHDGSSALEQAIDELVRARPKTRVVLPAGNSNLARLHAEVQFDEPKQTIPLHWRVLPDDKTPSFLEIWLPPGDPVEESRIGLRIMPPSGPRSEPALAERSGFGLQLKLNDGQILCEARYRHIPAPTNRGMFLVALQPTTRTEAAAPIAPSGIWTVELENLAFTRDHLIEAWIQRDDTPFGFRRRGRQSYFDHECYRRFDARGREIERDTHPEQAASPCHVSRAGSTNAIATGEETIVAGGFLRKEGRAARYSAERASEMEPLPRYLAPSDDSLVHLGLRAAGTRSGSVATMNGTSVAAPQVTRWIADQLAEGLAKGGPASMDPNAPTIGPDGWSDPSFPGAGAADRDDRPSWPRPRPGKRAAEGVVHDAQTGRPAAPSAVGRPDPAGWEK